MTKITVAMASYNHEEFVGEAIESVLSQKDCDFDFSIVDDGSRDGTVRNILKYQDSRIKFIRLDVNQGACVALRKAIEGGQGEYVAILNSDDKFLPGKLKKQAEFLDTHPHIHAVFGYPQFIDAKNQKLGAKEHFYGDLFKQPNRSRQEWLNYLFRSQNALCHPTLMIRRVCYQTLGYYDPRLAQLPDFDFWVRLLFKYEIHIMPEELIQFRILSGERNTSAPRLDSANRLLWELYHVLENYLKIPSIEEFLSIFPEEAGHVLVRDPELVHFYLAQLALRIDSPNSSIYRLLGLNILFSMLSKPAVHEKLKQRLNYTYPDFIKNSGTHCFIQKLPAFPLLTSYLKKMGSLRWWMNKIRTKVNIYFPGKF